MKKFKFRAQAALDLRQRELEAAQRQLARTEELRDAARRRLEQADEAATGAREHDVTQAAAACMRAKQRRESLDRFRKKAQAAHEEAELAAEMKVIDELATRRYGRASAAGGSATKESM